MIPKFDAADNLPPGIHWATWEEITDCFGWTKSRKELLLGLRKALQVLQKAGCDTVYLNGSFVTSKENPNDFDACWDVENVSLELLDPVLMDFGDKQKSQKKKFGGELFPNLPEDDDSAFLKLFQTDKTTGAPKGIIAIDLRTFE